MKKQHFFCYGNYLAFAEKHPTFIVRMFIESVSKLGRVKNYSWDMDYVISNYPTPIHHVQSDGSDVMISPTPDSIPQKCSKPVIWRGRSQSLASQESPAARLAHKDHWQRLKGWVLGFDHHILFFFLLLLEFISPLNFPKMQKLSILFMVFFPDVDHVHIDNVGVTLLLQSSHQIKIFTIMWVKAEYICLFRGMTKYS